MKDEYISRQAVNRLQKYRYNCGVASITCVSLNSINTLPPVTPQPKTGHWSHDGSHWKNRFICSECGYKLFDEPTNYCPNCGCAMKGE